MERKRDERERDARLGAQQQRGGRRQAGEEAAARERRESQRGRMPRGTRGVQHFVQIEEFLCRDAGVVARSLRAIGAIFRAAAGLDGQQRRKLHPRRIEGAAMNVLRAKHQFGKRQVEQRANLFPRPVAARLRGILEQRLDLRREAQPVAAKKSGALMMVLAIVGAALGLGVVLRRKAAIATTSGTAVGDSPEMGS